MPRPHESTTGADPDDTSVWTFVRGRRRHRPPPLPPPRQGQASTGSRSAADVAAEHDRVRGAWLQTGCCAELRRIVASSGCRVDGALCLGIGSFASDEGRCEARRMSFLQLVAFAVMVEELEKITGSPIPSIFQEPLFTPTDRQFLTSLGYQVVETPEGYNHTSRHSFIFGIHLYRPVYAMALSAHLPALFVGTGWPVWESVSLSESPDLDNLKTMHEHFAKAAFPQDASSSAFSSTTIYWRRPDFNETEA
ncbi:SRR1 domain-containing protein [Ophiocordyceps camponoti-floridani]|uniref:SRR1 domain-containing protein n=1 Tax=Ophiocordyceps camponoti-floridani TaxID=2030778 RepID=A0A8H4Q769_9HYPO|nr:SRR1 domain-containing protein [Ophiocordyceps camponoti-floridani]